MTAHNNAIRVVLEIEGILVLVPLLGLFASVVLWVRARYETDPDRKQYLRIGLASACVAFLVPLCAACMRQPASGVTRYVGAVLPLLCLAGLLSSLTAVILLVINGRGAQRVGGALLGLLGLVYCGLTLLGYGGGGGGY